MSLISQLCGSITPEVWPDVTKYDLFKKVELNEKKHERKLKHRLRNFVRDELGLQVIDSLLILDPKKRMDSDEALNHDFFWTDPMPSKITCLEKLKSSMFEYLVPPRNKARHNHQHLSQQQRSHGNGSKQAAVSSSQHVERIF